MRGVKLRAVRAAVAGLALAACGASAQATNVCGPINVNTTWNVLGSPYILTCDVVVTSGAVLTIDPGVVVRFGPNMRLKAQNGVISAIGTSSNHIAFTSISDPPGFGVELDFGNGGDASFTYCDFSNLNTAIQSNCCNNSIVPGQINNCTFIGCTFGMLAYHGALHRQVNNSTFTNNTYGTFYMAYADFNGCTFANNGTAGADVGGQCQFTLCAFNGNPTGITSQTGQQTNLDRCTVQNNVIGIKGCDVIQRCSIFNNVTGIQVNGVPQIGCNDIYSNSTYNIEMLSATTVNAPNNWWGTTNTSTIDAGIRDGFDQVSLGFVMYTPILTGAWNTGPCNCVSPTVTAASPATITKFSGASVAFSVTGGGTGPLSYQWFRNGVPLNNNGRVSGVNTPTLTIAPIYRSGGDASWTDAGQFSCRVSNLCGNVMSVPANLSVTNCFADFNQSGTITVQDLFDFLAAYFSGCP